MPFIIFNQRNIMNSDLPAYKIMFDKSLLKDSNHRVIINLKPGSDISLTKRMIVDICGENSEPVEFKFISAISCKVTEETLNSIIQLEAVQKVYWDEQVKLDVSSAADISFEEIFQLNECATQINSRAVPFTGQGVNISILDTGIDFTHADLSGKLLAQTSFVKTAYGFDPDEEEDPMDYNGHGTHCAGIATGTGSSAPAGYNLTGIAPNAKLLNAKCLNRFGVGYVSSIIAAIEWSIAQKAMIISMSLGFPSSDPDHPVCRAVDNATKAGIVVVVAAGNSGPFFSTVGSPGSARSVITVGATDKQDKITDFSSRGATKLGFVDPDVVAPGKDVLSTIAHSSLLGAIMERKGYYVAGTSGNDYAILSGTSMSCPMVAGAAALLLEAFPTLTPYQVRVALMKGAESLGYSPNVEGAGRVNVYNSYTALLQSTPEFNISLVLPQRLPIPPLEFSLFPGDTYTDDFLILLGRQLNMSVRCTGNVSPYIMLLNTTANEIPINKTLLYIQSQDSFYTNLEVVFKIPLSLSPGYYSGIIEIRDNDTQLLLETVNLSFNVRPPRGRVYFDCFHNSDDADSVKSNYYNFTKLLFENNIAVTFGKSLLTFPLLSQYDLLILPDIELPFTARERAEIQKYWSAGGNILILGSFYPQTAVEALNELLRDLDVGINYTETNIERSYDIGILKYMDDFLITDIEPHPITAGVSQFTWLSGVALEVDSNKASSVASYSNMSVIGIYNQSNHKIVCMGCERFFYDDFISKSYNEKLVLQTISWLLNGSSRSNSRSLRVEVIANQSIQDLGTNNETMISFYVSDPTTNNYIDNLIPHVNLSCRVLYYNAGWIPIWTGNASDVIGLGTGAYYFNFSTSLQGLYLVNITIENLSSSQTGIGIAYFNMTMGIPKITSSSITTSANEGATEYDATISNDIYRNTDQVIFNITLHDDTIADIQNVTCYITSLDAYRSDIKYLSLEMENITPKIGTEANYSLTLAPDYNFPAGTYHAFIEIVDSNGNSDYSSTLFEFYVDNKYPQFNWTGSTLNGYSLQYLKDSLSSITLQCGDTFTVEITGNDTESNLAEMYGYVILFNILTVGMTAYLYEPLWGAEVPFVTDRFSGKLSLPSDCVSQILDESYTLSGTLVMLMVLLDSDGQYDDDSYGYAYIQIQSPLPLTMIIIIVCVLAALAVFLYVWFRKKK